MTPFMIGENGKKAETKAARIENRMIQPPILVIMVKPVKIEVSSAGKKAGPFEIVVLVELWNRV